MLSRNTVCNTIVRLKPSRRVWWGLLVAILVTLLLSLLVARDAKTRYTAQLSVVVYDRHNTPLSVSENVRGHYVLAVTSLPKSFESLLLKKEDRFFYYHLGINPISTVRAAISYISGNGTAGASTISQQLAKNLLGTESERTFANKIHEAVYAFSLELFTSKQELLHMYANTVYLGNQLQGFETASHAYFDKPLSDLTHSEQLALLTTLSYPSTRNPWEEDNAAYALTLNTRISPDQIFVAPITTTHYSFRSDAYFELQTAGVTCDESCHTTLDATLTKNLRDILNRHITSEWNRGIHNGAIVVIDPDRGEILTFIGSRDPNSARDGDQINMAVAPRPIGSTIKPFIYVRGFMEGLRPYSLVEDREYKYPIATGFSLYPKNYDGQYRGQITLHEALSNSLNVPSVKVLEYIGLQHFYDFLSDELAFTPIQDYDSYQYGIALGGLEMDLLTLTHYFTIFPTKGYLAPLRITRDTKGTFSLPPQASITKARNVVPEAYIELVHAILSDRYTGVNQFGVKGNLNLTTSEYGVKTGTSRDFHDSWVVGYTRDLVVGVWLGNSENTPLEQVSGASGAGAVWHDVMEYLLGTPYNSNASFSHTALKRFEIDNNEEWGLMNDIVSDHRYLLQTNDLILSVHHADTFELTTDMTTIPLKAQEPVVWTVNGMTVGTAQETSFTPDHAGWYEVIAIEPHTKQREIVQIEIIQPN